MPVYLHNNGQPGIPEHKRRPFYLQGWPEPIPVGGTLEITDALLTTMFRDTGEDSARDFADFVAEVYNANRGTWLSVVAETSEPETAPAEPEPAPVAVEPEPEPEATPPEQDES